MRKKALPNGVLRPRLERKILRNAGFVEKLGTTMASVDYMICATGLLIAKNSQHSAASITMLLCRSTKNPHFPALTGSGCEVALFDEPPPGQIGCSLIIGCAAYSFDVSDHDVVVCWDVRF